VSVERFDCASARRAVHARLDAEPLDDRQRQRLERHLAGCDACRRLADELRAIQGGLRSLPEMQLPDEILERVWNRTTRRSGGRSWFYAAAAAALLLAVLGGMWIERGGGAEPRMSDAELRRAAVEARLVLGLTSRALRRGGRTADRVLTDEISPALRKVPIRWPEAETQRSGS